MEINPDGHKMTGLQSGWRDVLYANGPVIEPYNRADLPAFQPLAWFRTELAENGAPVGVMVNSPAIVIGMFGKGRVLTSSPHPEQTKGMEGFVETAVRSVARHKGPAESVALKASPGAQ